MGADGQVTRLVDRYIAAWNERDAASRLAILHEIWAQDGAYVDPRADTRGIAELSDHIGRIQSGRPGAYLIRTSEIDRHHTVLRFLWRLVLADGTRQPESIDIGELSPEGKLQRIVGFFGPAKPVE